MNSNNIPKGYTEIDKAFIADVIKDKGLNIYNVDGVYIGKGEIVITGIPDDELHNCDEMGCSSLSHVLCRFDI